MWQDTVGHTREGEALDPDPALVAEGVEKDSYTTEDHRFKPAGHADVIVNAVGKTDQAAGIDAQCLSIELLFDDTPACLDKGQTLSLEFLQNEALTTEQAAAKFLVEGDAEFGTQGGTEKGVFLADDATTQLFGIDNPAFAIIPNYPMHPITREITSLTLYPEATAIEVETPVDWQVEPLLTTLDRAWTEIGPISGTIRFDEDSDERMGPLDIGFVFSRQKNRKDATGGEDGGEQRVIVVGDSDFLSNAYLGNGGNIDLGLNLFNWLNHDDQFIAITARTASDINLELGKAAQLEPSAAGCRKEHVLLCDLDRSPVGDADHPPLERLEVLHACLDLDVPGHRSDPRGCRGVPRARPRRSTRDTGSR